MIDVFSMSLICHQHELADPGMA